MLVILWFREKLNLKFGSADLSKNQKNRKILSQKLNEKEKL